jgi:type I restriction enzyme S subunit
MREKWPTIYVHHGQSVRMLALSEPSYLVLQQPVKEPKPSVPIARALEDLPGWRGTELANTGLYINGLAFKPSDWGTSGRPIIRIQNLSGLNRDYNYAEGDFPDDNLANAGDLLVSWSATLDTFIWDGPQGVVNQHSIPR